MKFGLKENEIDLIVQILQKYPAIKTTRIFGSRANGKFQKNSDIDLAISGDLDLDLIAALKQDFIESDLIYKVDIVDYTKANANLKESIDKNFVLLF